MTDFKKALWDFDCMVAKIESLELEFFGKDGIRAAIVECINNQTKVTSEGQIYEGGIFKDGVTHG